MRIHFNDLINGSDYELLVLPFYREQAAKTIQTAFRNYQKLKITLGEFQQTSRTQLVKRQQLALLIYHHRRHKSRFDTLNEPLDDGFQQQLVQIIRTKHYEAIDYSHEQFIPHLFAVLRAGHISSAELLTVNLLYESLFLFNPTRTPNARGLLFSRYDLGQVGPYQPFYMIKQWTTSDQDLLMTALTNPLVAADHHYYTINLTHQQSVFLLYSLIKLTGHSNGYAYVRLLLSHYLAVKTSLNMATRQQINLMMEQFLMAPTLDLRASLSQSLGVFLLSEEPDLGSFLAREHGYRLSLFESEDDARAVDQELGSLEFLLNLMITQVSIPLLCPSYEISSGDIHPPLFSFVLPTMPTLQLLQEILYGAEAVLPVAVLGPLSTRLIRAYDEIPYFSPQQRLTIPQQNLALLYPTAMRLTRPARPVELTYPGVQSTHRPHHYPCHPFLLTWHDLFHVWRSGSNAKVVVRKFRQLHDEKVGLAVDQSGMSKVLWELSDVDLGTGELLRMTQRQLGMIPTSIRLLCLLKLLRMAGFDFAMPTDDNYLLAYHFCHDPTAWQGLLFGFDLSCREQFSTRTDIPDLYKQEYQQFHQVMLTIQWHLTHQPTIALVKILLKELLSPLSRRSAALLDNIEAIGYEKIFYWSKNDGLYFRRELAAVFAGRDICLRLRGNEPVELLQGLQLIVQYFTPSVSLSAGSKQTFFAQGPTGTKHHASEHSEVEPKRLNNS